MGSEADRYLNKLPLKSNRQLFRLLERHCYDLSNSISNGMRLRHDTIDKCTVRVSLFVRRVSDYKEKEQAGSEGYRYDNVLEKPGFTK